VTATIDGVEGGIQVVAHGDGEGLVQADRVEKIHTEGVKRERCAVGADVGHVELAEQGVVGAAVPGAVVKGNGGWVLLLKALSVTVPLPPTCTLWPPAVVRKMPLVASTT
jgi:hypothetical protein